MVPGRVSILIPSNQERFLNQTIADVLAKAKGDVEVVVGLDGGVWPDTLPPDDDRVTLVHWGATRGMRATINACAAVASGEFLMKLDGHCMVDYGFDAVLTADCADDWVVVPRRTSLDPAAWALLDNGKAPVDAHFLSYPFVSDRPGAGLHGTVWLERAKARKDVLLDEEMNSQGSCWFMRRTHWARLGGFNEPRYGSFIQEFQEIGLKTWLDGGRVMVNKQTSYAHFHKGKTGRGYFIDKRDMTRGAAFCTDYWMHVAAKSDSNAPAGVGRHHWDLEWLIRRFWPVPTWPTMANGSLDWDRVQRDLAVWDASKPLR